jgi:hypothetical protein
MAGNQKTLMIFRFPAISVFVAGSYLSVPVKKRERARVRRMIVGQRCVTVRHGDVT